MNQRTNLQKNNKPWLNHWPTGVPNQIEYPTIPLQQILTKASQTHPKKTAIAYAEQNITYMQLETLSNQFANALAKLSVKKGDRVAVFLPNIPEFIIAFFGILKAGAAVTTISPCTKNAKSNTNSPIQEPKP